MSFLLSLCTFTAKERARIKTKRDVMGYMNLEWPAGETQADFYMNQI